MSRYVQKPENPRLVVRRGLNAEYRSREYLTLDEVELLLIAANCWGRHPSRDRALLLLMFRALLLLMFRHGLRVLEAISLRWDAVMWKGKAPSIMIRRLKGSESGSHPLQLDEVELLRELKVEYPGSSLLFVSERGGGLSVAGVQKSIRRCGGWRN